MKLSGSAVLHAPPERVWEALNDPAVLERTIPGCQQLSPDGPDSYRMTVTAGVASIKGSYLGSVRLTDKQEPSSYVLHASGSGGPGTVDAECSVRLVDAGDGTTRLDYSADAVVGGVIAGVGQRMLAAVAKKMAGQFFSAVDVDLSGVRAEAAPVAAQPAVAAEPAVASHGNVSGRLLAVHSGRETAVDVRSVVAGGVAGAAIALLGVLVGARVALRRRS